MPCKFRANGLAFNTMAEAIAYELDDAFATYKVLEESIKKAYSNITEVLTSDTEVNLAQVTEDTLILEQHFGTDLDISYLNTLTTSGEIRTYLSNKFSSFWTSTVVINGNTSINDLLQGAADVNTVKGNLKNILNILDNTNLISVNLLMTLKQTLSFLKSSDISATEYNALQKQYAGIKNEAVALLKNPLKLRSEVNRFLVSKEIISLKPTTYNLLDADLFNLSLLYKQADLEGQEGLKDLIFKQIELRLQAPINLDIDTVSLPTIATLTEPYPLVPDNVNNEEINRFKELFFTATMADRLTILNNLNAEANNTFDSPISTLRMKKEDKAFLTKMITNHNSIKTCL